MDEKKKAIINAINASGYEGDAFLKLMTEAHEVYVSNKDERFYFGNTYNEDGVDRFYFVDVNTTGHNFLIHHFYALGSGNLSFLDAFSEGYYHGVYQASLVRLHKERAEFAKFVSAW